jgi:AraC-like DNA-binding protein
VNPLGQPVCFVREVHVAEQNVAVLRGEGPLFRVLAPSPQLAPYIHRYRVLYGSASAVPLSAYPDGALELLISFGGSVQRRRFPFTVGTMWVVGPGMDTDYYSFNGTVDILNITIKRGAGLSLFGVSPAALRGHWVELETFWPATVIERLANLANIPIMKRLAAVESILLSTINETYMPMPALREALLQIDLSGGQASLRGLATKVGLSPSTLNRGFHEYIGLGPKEYSRLARFWRVIKELKRNQMTLAVLAQEAGFYDQAHLNNEILALTGLTPVLLKRSFQADDFLQDSSELL